MSLVIPYNYIAMFQNKDLWQSLKNNAVYFVVHLLMIPVELAFSYFFSPINGAFDEILSVLNIEMLERNWLSYHFIYGGTAAFKTKADMVNTSSLLLPPLDRITFDNLKKYLEISICLLDLKTPALSL